MKIHNWFIHFQKKKSLKNDLHSQPLRDCHETRYAYQVLRYDAETGTSSLRHTSPRNTERNCCCPVPHNTSATSDFCCQMTTTQLRQSPFPLTKILSIHTKISSTSDGEINFSPKFYEITSTELSILKYRPFSTICRYKHNDRKNKVV